MWKETIFMIIVSLLVVVFIDTAIPNGTFGFREIITRVYGGEPTSETPINETPDYNETHKYIYEPESKTWIIVPKDFKGGGETPLPPEIKEITITKLKNRTLTSTTYQTSDGKYYTTAGGFMNYWNGSEFKEINTTIISSNSLWDYEVTQGVFQAYFKENPTTGQVVKFSKDNSDFFFQPMALNYRNDLNQLQQISMIQASVGTPQENKFIYPDAYGQGIDLTYKYYNSLLKEELIIENRSDLIDPSQYILDGGNPTIDLEFIIATNEKMLVNGEQWDKNSIKQTQNEVIIIDSNNNELYRLKQPRAYDSNGSSTILTYEFSKSGNNLFIKIKTPYLWLNNLSRAYPVFIDPSIGPNSPGTVVDNASVGTATWSFPNYAKESDTLYSDARVDSFGAKISHYLKATNFSFSIPSGATIDGIVVEFERYSPFENGARDSQIKIVKSDDSIGTENKSVGGAWSTTEDYYSYGGSSDLWSETWSDTDINDVDFGVVLSAKGGGVEASVDARVNHIRITVYYTELDTIPPSFSSNKTNASVTTYNGTDVQINLTITDNTAVDFYTLTHNDTAGGTWANESFVSAGDTSPITMVWNYSITNFPTAGGTMGWRVWANDTAGNVNISNIYTFDVQPIVTDSCSYTKNSNWLVSDQCIKTNEYVDLGTGNLTILTGGSVIFINSNITLSHYNISTTDTNKVVINISWSSNTYFFNISNG